MSMSVSGRCGGSYPQPGLQAGYDVGLFVVLLEESVAFLLQRW